MTTKKQNYFEFVKMILVIPFCVGMVLAAFSLLLGWNLITLIIFWFIIVPLLSLYLSSKLLGKENEVSSGMISMTSFYAIMVFMIYRQAESDFFKIMMVSFLYNLLILITVMLSERRHTKQTDNSAPIL